MIGKCLAGDLMSAHWDMMGLCNHGLRHLRRDLDSVPSGKRVHDEEFLKLEFMREVGYCQMRISEGREQPAAAVGNAGETVQARGAHAAEAVIIHTVIRSYLLRCKKWVIALTGLLHIIGHIGLQEERLHHP